MSDNSVRTPGTGESIRTRDRSSVKTEIVGLDVSDSSGSERLGLPPRKVITATSSGLTTATTAYVTGDVLGGELTFANAARYTAGGCEIISAVIIDKADITGAIDLYIFDAASTPAADNAANSWTDANMALCQGVISFPAPFDSALNRVGIAVGGLPLICTPAATSLFGVMVTRTGHTFFGAATDLIVKLGVISD